MIRPRRMVRVEAVGPEVLERAGISGGVVVREVIPGSVAAQSGLVAGDVITLIDTSPIKSTESYDKAVDKLKGGSSVPLRLIRRGSPMFIGLKVPE